MRVRGLESPPRIRATRATLAGRGGGRQSRRQAGGRGAGSGTAGWALLIRRSSFNRWPAICSGPHPSHVSSPLESNLGCARGLSSYSQKKNSLRAGRAEDGSWVACPLGVRLKMTRDLGESPCSGPDPVVLSAAFLELGLKAFPSWVCSPFTCWISKGSGRGEGACAGSHGLTCCDSGPSPLFITGLSASCRYEAFGSLYIQGGDAL